MGYAQVIGFIPKGDGIHDGTFEGILDGILDGIPNGILNGILDKILDRIRLIGIRSTVSTQPNLLDGICSTNLAQ